MTEVEALVEKLYAAAAAEARRGGDWQKQLLDDHRWMEHIDAHRMIDQLRDHRLYGFAVAEAAKQPVKSAPSRPRRSPTC